MFDSFRQAAPGRQMAMVGGAALLLCALLFGAWYLLVRAEYGVLFSSLRTMDAATIVAELDKQKVPYRLEQGGTTITVPEDQVDSTRLAVMGQDLPLKGQVGFELFNKSDMGLTEFAQKINYQRALQGELSRTIMTMDAVDTARIHLALSERTVFRDDRVPPKASVTVVPRPGKRITAATVRGIQKLVSAAVPDLDADNVVVIDGGGRVVSADSGPADDQSPQGQQRRAVERLYENQVKQAVVGLVPGGDVEVKVWAAPIPVSQRLDPAIGAAKRDFRLQVSISVGRPISGRSEEEIKAAAATAVGADPAVGDVIAVSLASAAEPQDQPWSDPSAVPMAAPRAAVQEPASSYVLWAIGVLVVGLIGIALLRRGRKKPLSEAQRAELAGRFKALLEREEANV
ncbi:MAG: flagellar M-ring protein FliF [Alphaproteobacteria bacterium]|nr:MAG: flagellar M-ring protein FliF [Alphaproteobacteria bacterium]